MSDDPMDWPPEEWAALEADLEELERTDPDVAAAAENYRAVRQRIIDGLPPGGPL